jgi:phenylacetate-CoA ligase
MIGQEENKLYASLFEHALFPMYETLLRRRSTASNIREYRRNQWLSSDELSALQLSKLNALLTHCWQHVPALQRHWRAAGCEPGALRNVGELTRYPTIGKQFIVDNYDDMIAVPLRGRTLSKVTSGSTGVPFRFEYTMDVYARRTAVMWRGYGWAGAGLGTRTAYLWGTGLRTQGWGAIKDKLYHSAFNRHFFDAISLSDATIDATIADIVAYRPKAVVGYVAPLVLVARRMLQTNTRIEGVGRVLTGAEGLLNQERSDLEEAFGCPVFNTYGSREVMLMASECESHEGLHVNADHLVLETLDARGNASGPGVSGDVAITDLHNFGMPMVRYLNGDCATYHGNACSCGRSLPLLSSVDGRLLDLIKTPDGRHLPGEFFSMVMLDMQIVKQWQVVQTDPDRLEVRVIVKPGWSVELRDRVLGRIRAKSGQSMRLDLVEVDSIAPARSGKRRLTIALENRDRTPELHV